MAARRALPFPAGTFTRGGVSLPAAIVARLRNASINRDAPIKRVLYEAVAAQIDRVEAEPRARPSKRTYGFPDGSTSAQFDLPTELYARCMAIVRTTNNSEGDFTGSLSYVFRRCIALQYPEPAPAGGPAAPQTKEPPVASIIVLLPIPPALHTWLRQQSTDMSKQIRGAIDAHLPAVAVNTKVSKATSPYRGKGQMKPVPLRVPLTMHAALKDAAVGRGVTMSAIARICIALHVQAAVRPVSTHSGAVPA